MTNITITAQLTTNGTDATITVGAYTIAGWEKLRDDCFIGTVGLQKIVKSNLEETREWVLNQLNAKHA